MVGPLTGSPNDFKKSIGRLVLLVNADTLELQKVFRRVKDGGANLSTVEQGREKVFKERIAGLEGALESLAKKPDTVKRESFERYINMMKTTVESANTVMSGNFDITEDTLEDVQKEAKTCVEEIILVEEEIKIELSSLNKTLSSLAMPVKTVESEPDVGVEHEDDQDLLQMEVDHLDSYSLERFSKIKEEIIMKMKSQTAKLETTWKEEKST